MNPSRHRGHRGIGKVEGRETRVPVLRGGIKRMVLWTAEAKTQASMGKKRTKTSAFSLCLCAFVVSPARRRMC